MKMAARFFIACLLLFIFFSRVVLSTADADSHVLIHILTLKYD